MEQSRNPRFDFVDYPVVLFTALNWESQLLDRCEEAGVERFEPFGAQWIGWGWEEKGLGGIVLFSDGGAAGAVDLELDWGLVVCNSCQCCAAIVC